MSSSRSEHEAFIPATREIDVGGGVVYRPIRSWHSGTFAGEGIRQKDADRSGCLFSLAELERLRVEPKDDEGGPPALRMTASMLEVCRAPLSVTHRLYWHKDRPDRCISAILSYPNALGYVGEPVYFWEALIGSEPDRWTGDDAESEMERAIVAALQTPETEKAS